eukprot:6592235-Alexandrium_andersonii.AAC.1
MAHNVDLLTGRHVDMIFAQEHSLNECKVGQYEAIIRRQAKSVHLAPIHDRFEKAVGGVGVLAGERAAFTPIAPTTADFASFHEMGRVA